MGCSKTPNPYVMDTQYVLCRWRDRFWPAKVVAESTAPGNPVDEMEVQEEGDKDLLLVEILSLNQRVRVRGSEAELLSAAQIEGIAALLASQQEAPAAPMEELTYRRALRVALDLLGSSGAPPRANPGPRALGHMDNAPSGGTPEPEEEEKDEEEEEGKEEKEEPEEEDRRSSLESGEVSPTHSAPDEEDPPRILCYHEPRSFEVGMLVWLKYHKYPFWPAVVKSIRRRERKASVLFIEGNMDPKGRGMAVSLRRLKHFDCKEKQALLKEAKESFDQAIGWCVELITDYRVRLGCGSFSGSFLEYYSAAISSPVRRSIERAVQGARFPAPSLGRPEEPRGPARALLPRKVLPDRSRAARDRANLRLVDFIERRGAERHLRAVLRGRAPSRWLRAFLRPRPAPPPDPYLEDDAQLDRVVAYLQGLARRPGPRLLAAGDRVRLVLDVLLPEAIICAIAAVDGVDYKTAEQKYIQGPPLGHREKEMFDSRLLEERSQRS